MTNLLIETLECLRSNGKSEHDVLWCGNREFCFRWSVFAKLANRKYDNGYGGNEVASDLLVVGKDFWLERHEYDGSEWWEYKEYPTKPEIICEPEDLFCGHQDLKQQNKEPIG